MGKEVICGIYKITNTINRNCYIGSSINIYKRWALHKTPSQHKLLNNQLYKDMDKYGIENFKFEIISITNKENLKIEEQKAIENFRPYYNNNRAYGLDLENARKLLDKWRHSHKERHNYFSKRYAQAHKEQVKQYHNQYNNRLCCFNNEILTFNALLIRFRRKKIENPSKEAEKYLIKN